MVHLGRRAKPPVTFFGREHGYFIKIYFLLSKWFQTRKFLWEFPIGFYMYIYVKLSSAVVAISVGGLKCRIQFWKGTTQGSSQQSLVEIGSVVSEENIFFKFHPPFFLFLAWRPSWLKIGITRHNCGRGLSKDHSTKVWLELTQWFMKRRFLCEFPIGFYVKLCSAVGASLVEGPNRRTHFWTLTIQ